MIIESLINIICSILYTILQFVNIPAIPQDTLNSVNDTINLFITRASELIELVLPYSVARALLLIVISVEVGIHLYHFILWVLKKIPMLGIE